MPWQYNPILAPWHTIGRGYPTPTVTFRSRGFGLHIWCPYFLHFHLRDRPPQHSVLKASMIYVHETYKTMVNKGAVLNRHAHTCAVLDIGLI